jgi:hypothetical protein
MAYISTTTEPRNERPNTRRTWASFSRERRLFLASTLAATVFPILFVVVFAGARDGSRTVDNIFSLLLILSTMHVALTLFFYCDRRYLGHFGLHHGFYYSLPVALILGAGLLNWQLGNEYNGYLFLFYHAWLLFHYGRQNYGLLCFVAIATQSTPPLKIEKLILHLVPIGAIVGAMPLLKESKNSIFAPVTGDLFNLGVMITVFAGAILALAFLQHVRARSHPLRVVFLACLRSWATLLPTHCSTLSLCTFSRRMPEKVVCTLGFSR